MEFHILSFEGPDAYARAGGIASRISGLSEALAVRGNDTHLWFVGDPHLPGHEQKNHLYLHRWCQWISHYHPLGVYDGEEGKKNDYASSLPPFLMANYFENITQNSKRMVVLAEEWHTVDAILHLDALLRHAGVRDRVTIIWNANNVFGFDRIDWPRLRNAAVVSTVSRYMKHILKNYGIDAIVVPNGVDEDAFIEPDMQLKTEFLERVHHRTVLTKIARWDPDKRWLLAIEIIAGLKKEELNPLFIARGGMETHGNEVLGMARSLRLKIEDRNIVEGGAAGILQTISDTDGIDILNLRTPVDSQARKLLYAASDCVLANSIHEPFGLVALETMATRGLACTGCSGEDYAIAGRNALVLQTNQSQEFIQHFARLREHPAEIERIRNAGHETAKRYTWSKIIQQILLPQLDVFGAIGTY